VGPNGVGKSTLLAPWRAGGGSGADGADGGGASRGASAAPGVWVATVAQSEGDGGEAPDATLYDLAHAACAPLLELGAELERRAAALGATPEAAALEAYGAWQALFAQRGGYDLEARLDEALTRIGLPAPHERRRPRPRAASAGGRAWPGRWSPAPTCSSSTSPPTTSTSRPAAGWPKGCSATAARRVRVPRPRLDRRGGHPRAGAGRGHRRARCAAAGRAARRSVDEARRADEKAERLRRRRTVELEAMAAELRAQGHRRADVRRRRAERELDALRAKARAGARRRIPPVALEAGRSGGELARFEHLRAGDLIVDVGLTLRGGDRWALIGPSGSGKSTLLRLMAGEVDSDDPRARRWWRPGPRCGTSTSTARPRRRRHAARRRSAPGWARRERGAAGGRAPARATWTRPAATLSGGERARAGVALLMAREADVLLLDEPTNDLDLPAIEALEAALVATPAVVVVATHDARLVEALGAEVVTIESGALVRWRGGLAGWRRGVRRLTPEAADADARRGRPAPDRAGGRRRPADDEAWDLERRVGRGGPRRPPALGRARDRALAERRRAAEEALLAAWERTATPAQPPYRTREGGWRVWGEPSRRWPARLARRRRRRSRTRRCGSCGPRPRPRRPRGRGRRRRAAASPAGPSARCCTAPPAWRSTSTPSTPCRSPPITTRAASRRWRPGWWVRRRVALERDEGWRRPAAQGRRGGGGRGGRRRRGRGRGRRPVG
jgi:ATP-binding cassette, subfamily F, member 3